MQRVLTARGLYKDKVDGRAGMLTRSALGAYQKANGLKLDCWPTARGARPHGEVRKVTEHTAQSKTGRLRASRPVFVK